ncbi:MAG: TrkA family potassium uptake protein [Nanoarchaeota archaeon]
MAKHNFAVVGVGKFGSNMAITLEQLGHPVLALDKDEIALDKVKNYVTSAKVVDTSDREALLESGIKNCDTVIVAIGSNADASFLTTLNLKEMGIAKIIAKAHTLEQGRILEKIGATKVVYPEKESAIRLGNQLTSSDVLEQIEISPDYLVNELEVSKEFVGKSLEAIGLRKKNRVMVVAIKRAGETIMIPVYEEVVAKGDILVLVAHKNDMQKFREEFKI